MDGDLKLFSHVLTLIKDKDLPSALDLILPYSRSHQYIQYTGELESIDESLRLMLHYMTTGVSDPLRVKMYEDMLSRTNKAVRNIRSDYRRRNIEFYKDAASHIKAGMSASEDAIRQKLEDFVSDVALLQLESEQAKADKTRAVYSEHYSYMQSLFNYIVCSDLWTSEQADEFTDILLSPTVDSGDVQLIVSALMLAVMNSFDINKFGILTKVYKSATDIRVRQKALIGWVLSMSDSVEFDSQQALISDLCTDESVVCDVFDLQKQVLFCMNAEKDNDVIQRDIMPTLVRNSNLSVTRLGITEKEEDQMQDILDPGAQDRAMEETEEKFQQMLNMQKSGADIYFGGFSQMKRFPFFYTLSNWFCPFCADHPDLSKRMEKLDDSNFIDNLLVNGPFCDSDKYSFAFALATVIDKLPANVREMLGNSEMLGRAGVQSETNTAAYIRRQALQDLYRFFRLYRWREQIYNPFEKGNCLFVASKLFQNTHVSNKLVDIGYFLLFRKEWQLLDILTKSIANDTTTEAKILNGYFCLDYSGDNQTAYKLFNESVNEEPDNEKAWRGYAQAAFKTGDLGEARKAYTHLIEKNPKEKKLAIDLCVVLSKLGDYETALNVAYKMSFDFPDSANVQRILAWVLMGEGKLEKAEAEYDKLLAENNIADADYLNAGYCKWFSGNPEQAANLFASFCNRTIERKKFEKNGIAKVIDILEKEFNNDKAMLMRYSLSHIDMILMKAIVKNKILR